MRDRLSGACGGPPDDNVVGSLKQGTHSLSSPREATGSWESGRPSRYSPWTPIMCSRMRTLSARIFRASRSCCTPSPWYGRNAKFRVSVRLGWDRRMRRRSEQASQPRLFCKVHAATNRHQRRALAKYRARAPNWVRQWAAQNPVSQHPHTCISQT